MSRRIDILDAILEMFSAQGINVNITMKEIAEKVNIGKSTIYEYFETKEEMINQALQRLFSLNVEKIFATEFDDSLGFKEALYKELKLLFELALNSCEMISMINSGYSKALPEDLRDAVRGNVDVLKKHYDARFFKIFEKGYKDGLFDENSLSDNSFAITSLITGSIIRIANFEDSIDKSDINSYIDKVYNALLKLV